MPDQYIDFKVFGDIISEDKLIIPKAKELVRVIRLNVLKYIKFINCYRSIKSETLIFEVEVELGQKNINDIHRFESIAVVFSINDKSYPEVYALREKFPKVPHLNINEFEYPKSLCLYERPYSEIKINWTATRFIERIREWLAYTAKGKLHGEDQPLEPLFSGNEEQLIIPSDYFSREDYRKIDFVNIHQVNTEKPFTFIINKNMNRKDQIKLASVSFICDPLRHGIINKKPKTLLDLHKFASKAKLDLLTGLRNILKDYCSEEKYKNVLESFLILIIAFPKIRENGSEIETTDIWSFFCNNNIREIGRDLGIWEISNGKAVFLIKQENKKGENVELILLKTMFSFSKEMALVQNGLSKLQNDNFTLIGVGALGSQIFMNLIRAGLGKWNLIDNDIFLPHNLARHVLDNRALGFNKALYLSYIANNIIGGEPIAKAISKDVLNSDKDIDVQKALEDGDVIIDCSTSIAVARFLARDVKSSCRRISMFLNPNGNDCVILAEDKKRGILLDHLEMQYYRYIINNQEMEYHLKINEKTNRYGNSCRDINNSISQELIALHASICSHAFRDIIISEDANISIWRTNSNEFSVKKYYIQPLKMIEFKMKDWVLNIDEWLIDKISKARLEKLPNETGGILIGSFDMQRKIVYIVDTILSPSDSIEWPGVYIRGCQGLSEKVKEIKNNTLGAIDYVGEWHSHPDGSSCAPSGTDCKAFEMLSSNMRVDGLPTIMLISGDNSFKLYLDEM